MKKIALASVLGLALVASSAEAQTLEPQMSTQDISSQLNPEPGHVLVPILMMLFLLLTAGGASATGPVDVNF